MKMENRRVRTFTFMESFAVAGVKRSRSSAEGLRTVLALAFAAVIAVVGVFETPLMWGLVIPLAIVAVATAFYYQRAIDWEGGDSRPMYLGMFLVLPSVGAILVRGAESAALIAPLLSVAGGILAWIGLRWCERSPRQTANRSS